MGWGEGPRWPTRLAVLCSLAALWPLGLEAAQDELGCRLFCLEERNRHTITRSEESKI